MKNYKKIIITLVSLTIIFLIVYGFLNKNNSFLEKLYADVTNSNNGYTCDRYSGICYIDKNTSEYSNENDCLNQCPDLRFKWYCNKNLGQCVRDVRGNYTTQDACWKNCYKTLQYYCDMVYGFCQPKGAADTPKRGDMWTGVNGVYSMDIEECSQKCRPITNSYTFYPTTKKCLWTSPHKEWNKENYSKFIKERWASNNDTTVDEMKSATKDLLPLSFFIAQAIKDKKDTTYIWANYIVYLKTNIPNKALQEKVIDWANIEKQIDEQFTLDNTGTSEKYLSWTECASQAGIKDPSTAKIKYSCQDNIFLDVPTGDHYGAWTSYFGNLVYVDGATLTFSPKQCYPSPTGTFESYESCFEACYQSPLEKYQNYSGWNCNYTKGVCSLTKINAEFQATTLEDSFEICKYNCSPTLDHDIISDYQCRFENQNKNTQTIINPEEHACFNRLSEKRDTCYSNSNCTIQNHVCANNHTSDPAVGWIEESTCKNNGWYWLGSYRYEQYKQLCVCQSGKCVATEPVVKASCGNNVCEEWEKYKYIHGNGSISTIVSRYYCPTDCN